MVQIEYLSIFSKKQLFRGLDDWVVKMRDTETDNKTPKEARELPLPPVRVGEKFRASFGCFLSVSVLTTQSWISAAIALL
jgi:hypothetical protein